MWANFMPVRPMPNYFQSDNSLFDVVVIGGGVVGCAIARRFTLEGARVALLEKAPDILAGASKGNSAILHTGFDAPPGSLELACIQAGYEEYMAIKDGLNLPVLETGAAVVAWTTEELAKLDEIEGIARQNGVGDVERLRAAELLQREPYLSQRCLGAVLVPREHAIDPWSAPLAYLHQAVANGAKVYFNTEVQCGSFDTGEWKLHTNAGSFHARSVVNCAGLFGDVVDQRLLGQSEFMIKPRKGQFVVFDKVATRYLRTIILPVPTERTKGVVVTRTIFGNLLVGPTAEEQDERERAATDSSVLKTLVEKAVEIIPALQGVPVTATYAGLRPATERKEYRISVHPDRRWITVGGIRSTGLTAALGIAKHVLSLHSEFAGQHQPCSDIIWPVVPNLAEHRPRDWQQPGRGEIVCHCELVTRREIEAAMDSPVPPGDLSGLKRRTRAGMGRCQGFYCNARLAELTQKRLADSLAIGITHD
jgi:glycerol-3-phosphate dehydrogenase